MADIAQLGIQAKTTGVKESASDLNQLTGAAARAEVAVEGFESASLGASGAANAAAAAYAKQGISAQTASRQIGVMAAAANQNVNRMGGSMSGLAAQFQDIGVTAAAGMNPMIIALQQGTQIAGQMEMALQGGASASAVLGQAFRSLLSPVAIVSIAMVAIAAALIQLVNWSKLGAAALNGLASVLEVIAPYAVAAAAGLALLYAPAIIGGIVSLIALMGRLVVHILGVAAAFALANPAAAFVLGLVAVVAAMNIFRDELKDIFGRDIVGDVKNAANFVIGAFVGAFNGIRAAWSTLPAVLGDIVYSTANAVIAGIEFMMNAVNERINNFIRGTNELMKSLPFGIGEGVSLSTIPQVAIPRIDNPYSGAVNNAASDVAKAISDAQGTDYVGKVTDVIAKGASTAAAKLREMAAGLLKVDDAKKKSSGKTDLEKYDDIVKGADRTIATLQAEYNAIGLTAEAAARLKYEQQLLNQANQAGITLSAAQTAELKSKAGEMARLETATADAKANLELAKSSATGFLSTLRQGLVAGEGWWASFGNAALSVLDKIASAIETSLVNSLFSSTGGGFNLLSRIGLGGSVAAGGVSGGAAGGSAIGKVAPLAAAARMPAAKAMQAANSNQQIEVTFKNDVDDNGNIVPIVTGIADKSANRAAGAVKANFDGWRRNGQHTDIESHLKNRRKIG